MCTGEVKTASAGYVQSGWPVPKPVGAVKGWDEVVTDQRVGPEAP